MTSWDRTTGRLPRARRPAALVAVVALGYAAGSLVSFLLFEAGSLGAVLFPPAGVTLAALLLTPGRQWPLVLVTAAAVEAALDLANGLPLSSVPGFVLANTVEPLVGATLVLRSGSGFDLCRRRDLGRFLLFGVVGGPLVGGLIGATTIVLTLDGVWLDAFLPFWAGDGLGALAIGGTVLTWAAAGRSARGAVIRRVLLALLTVAVSVVAFWSVTVPLAYLPIPLLFLFAVRYGSPVVTASGLAMTLTANVMTGEGHGPWAALAEAAPNHELATLQLFLAVAIGGAWLLAVESGERQRATTRSDHEAAVRRQVEALQDVTAGLATAATSEAIAEVVVRRGVAMLTELGAVGVLTSDGAALRTWTSEAPGRPRLVDLDSSELLAVAACTGGPVVVRSAAELAGSDLLDGAASALALPARIGGVTFGAIVVGFPEEDAVGPDVAALAGTLAELMVQALLRARLYEEERDAAHQLQRAFLPVVPERLAGVPIGGCYRPADQQHEIGGDWYDAFALPDGRIGFAVGDVVGHDLPAAAAMGRLHAALRVVAAAPHDGPRQVLDALDRACAHIPGAPLATIGYGEYEPASGRLRYACAGHPPPLLVVDGRAEFLLDGRSWPLAARDGVRPEAARTAPPGAMLLWYSDGLVERRDSDLDVGLARLAEVAETVEGESPQEWCDIVLTRLTGDRRVDDDVVLLCLRLERTPVPSVPAPREDEGDGVLTLPV